MKLIGLMPVRNEDWILGLSLRVALQWCDEVIVYLHACTDRSADIAYEIEKEAQGRTLIIRNPYSEWREMQHRQEMLNDARCMAATHIAIIDADEILTGNLAPTGEGREARLGVRGVAEMSSGHILQLPLYNLRGGIDRYHADGIWGNRIVSVAFADNPRLGWSGDQFHAREPRGATLQPYRPIAQGQGGVMHLWGASERRLRAKHALYKITERLRWPEKSAAAVDQMYSWAIHGSRREEWGNPQTWLYSPVPAEWWKPYEPWMKYLNVDAEPWQEAECRRLVAEHGREKFTGLDLFGVA